jgi:hypothetical protein
MAEKKPEIVLGEFRVRDNSDRDNVEIRLSDEKQNSNGVFRSKSLRGVFDRGATYEVIARVKEPAAEPPTVTAELPAEDRQSLPPTAEIVEQSSGKRAKSKG